MRDLNAICDAIEEATGTRPTGSPRPVGGGCINDAWELGDYFVKLNSLSLSEMFATEQLGLLELMQASSVKVPTPVCLGSTDSHSYLVLEHLTLVGSNERSQEQLGRQLSSLHRTTNPSFGWDQDNFIGSNHQRNDRCESWIEFLRERRLGHLLELAGGCGYHFRNATRLLDHLDRFFDEEPAASLLHGDLWGGNASALPDGTPVIFDPAVYYGDREADLAMTHLFGGFSGAFYAAYQEAWPLSPGHQERITLYNLYHVLNHAVLFGGSYARQAQSMIDQLVDAL